jgi:hypothetical protein
MRFSVANPLAIVLVAASFYALSGTAQQAQPSAPAQPDQHTGGKVIFSRSIDEDGQVQTQQATPAQTAQPELQMVSEPSAEDAERQAVTYTDLDLDTRIVAAAGHIAVRARVTVRNDGRSPLVHIPLQLSSSLNWERILVDGKDMPIKVATLNSDADHTGQLHEAAVALARPLAPGATLVLDVTYSGKIAATAQRLLAIGTPEDVALHSDWDQIGVDFTGLRGFGNVVWYPVSSVPVILGDGARLFDEIGEHKLRLTGAHFKMRLTVEFPHGQAPTVAVVNGHSVPLTVTEPGLLDQGQEVAGVATASLESTVLGFEAPSLFVAIRQSHPGKNFVAWTKEQNAAAVDMWSAAAAKVSPFLASWLGDQPRSQLILLDLPDSQDAPFETGALLVTAIGQGTSEKLEGILAHSLTHAWLPSPRAWLNEGLATFMGTLWVEKKIGRSEALGTLESGRAALALAEPVSPGTASGQPLGAAISPVYYRTKAAYVLWMLRDVAGDAAFSAALRGYDPAQDQGREGNPGSLQKLIEAAGARRDIAWIFTDWIDADKGLPDLNIDSVIPKNISKDSWLVAVNVSNDGYAAAEVPVTVRSKENSATQRLLIPARGQAVQRVMVQGKPIEVQVNDGGTPETEASVHVTKLTAEETNQPTTNVPGTDQH